MTLSDWHEEPVQKSHRRQEFDCGDDDMNQFLRQYARQTHERHIATTFCAIDDNDANRILGFYTVTPFSTGTQNIPSSMIKGLGRYDVGGYKLARIATDISVAGQGLGGQLLSAAALRCLRASEEVGGNFLFIDAKNERAARWYAKFGAESFADHPLMLVIPLETFAGDLASRRFLKPRDDSR